jgi:hypothetical protein
VEAGAAGSSETGMEVRVIDGTVYKDTMRRRGGICGF